MTVPTPVVVVGLLAVAAALLIVGSAYDVPGLAVCGVLLILAAYVVREVSVWRDDMRGYALMVVLLIVIAVASALAVHISSHVCGAVC